MNGNGQHATDKQSIAERERLYTRLLSAQSQRGSDVSSNDYADTPLETLEAVWAERAAQLARAPIEAQQGEQIEVLLVRLGREVLGIEVRFVVEIRQNEPVTRVPRVPSWVVGVTNLRGRILSVVDLRSFLGLPADPAHKDTSSSDAAQIDFLVEVESPDMELVFLVNEVLGVDSLPASSIQTESGLIHALPPEYLRGVMKQENGRWMTANGDNEKGKQRASKNGKKNGERQQADEKQAGGRREGVTVSILNLNALLSDPRLLINDYAGEDDIR